MEVVGGIESVVEGLGDFPCYFGDCFYILHKARFMPANKECSLGLTAMKINDGFTVTSHDVGTSLTLATNFDEFTFLSKTDMRFNNNMDYLPVKLAIFPSGTQWNDDHKDSANTFTTGLQCNVVP